TGLGLLPLPLLLGGRQHPGANGIAGDGRNRSVATRTAGWPLDNLLSHHFPLEPVVSGTSLVGELVPGLLGIFAAVKTFLAQLGHGRLQGGAFLVDALLQRFEAALVLGAGVDDDKPVGPAVQLAGVGAGAVHRTVGAFGQASDDAYVNRKVYHRDGEFLYHRTAGGPPWVQQRAFSAWRAGHA